MARRWLLGLALIAVGHSTLASADDAERSTRSSTTLTLRAELPFGGLTLAGTDGYLVAGGGAASLRVRDLWEAELGIRYFGLFPGRGPSVTARLGVAPSVVVPSPARTRWNLRIPVLAGYAFSALWGKDDGYDVSARLHELAGATGLDATFWSGIGFNVRLLGFAGVQFHERTDPFASDPIEHCRFAYGVNLMVGIALPL